MSELSINTTQNVNINFTVAAVGYRISAYFLDLLVKTAYSIVVFYVFFYWLGLNDFMDGKTSFKLLDMFDRYSSLGFM